MIEEHNQLARFMDQILIRIIYSTKAASIEVVESGWKDSLYFAVILFELNFEGVYETLKIHGSVKGKTPESVGKSLALALREDIRQEIEVTLPKIYKRIIKNRVESELKPEDHTCSIEKLKLQSLSDSLLDINFFEDDANESRLTEPRKSS
jgi:hypothetical protein